MYARHRANVILALTAAIAGGAGFYLPPEDPVRDGPIHKDLVARRLDPAKVAQLASERGLPFEVVAEAAIAAHDAGHESITLPELPRLTGPRNYTFPPRMIQRGQDWRELPDDFLPQLPPGRYVIGTPDGMNRVLREADCPPSPPEPPRAPRSAEHRAAQADHRRARAKTKSRRGW